MRPSDRLRRTFASMRHPLTLVAGAAALVAVFGAVVVPSFDAAYPKSTRTGLASVLPGLVASGEPEVRVQSWTSKSIHHTATADHLFGVVANPGATR